MGIDLATWRARIGLNYYHKCRPLQTRWRSSGGRLYQPGVASWGVGEFMNDTPLLLQSCIVVVSLLLVLEYTVHRYPIRRHGFGKVCHPKLRSGTVLSAETSDVMNIGTIGVCLLLWVCAVVLTLLLMAGDVERNPGPTEKEGNSYH